MECNASHCPACSEHHPTHRFGSGASQDCLRRSSDHGQVHDPGPHYRQGSTGFAAIHSKERKNVVQDYVEHRIDTQASIIKSAQEYQQKYIRSRAARHNKTPPLDAYKQDDWVLATWQGLSLGRSRPKKLGPCWRGPFQVVSVDSIRQTVTLRDPTDLLVMKPDVHVSQLRKHRMGLTGATDLIDLRAMDTAKDVIVRFIDHDMHYPQGKGSKNSGKLLPRRVEVQLRLCS